MSTGVIVARFQVYSLHPGHIHLIDTVIKKCKKLVIVLGKKTVPDENNILPGYIRGGMLMEYLVKTYGSSLDFMIHSITDHIEDKTWSEKLDDLVSLYSDITMYGSRDSFLSFYNGKHKAEIIPELVGLSGTQQRETMTIVNNEDFRKGMIEGFKLSKKTLK